MTMAAYAGKAFVLRKGKTVFYCYRSHPQQEQTLEAKQISH